MKISKNFTLEEMTASATAKARGISNNPGQTDIVNLCGLVHNVLQPLRNWWGKEVKIGSGYRSLALNRAVGGVSNSQHMKGEAADLCIDGDIQKGKSWFQYIKQGGAGRGVTAAGLSAARIRPDRVRVPRVAVSAA